MRATRTRSVDNKGSGEGNKERAEQVLTIWNRGVNQGPMIDAIRVMPGLVPGIHVATKLDSFRTQTPPVAPAARDHLSLCAPFDVDGRDKPGHDGTSASAFTITSMPSPSINLASARFGQGEHRADGDEARQDHIKRGRHGILGEVDQPSDEKLRRAAKQGDANGVG
jgi:hypothetical protein